MVLQCFGILGNIPFSCSQLSVLEVLNVTYNPLRGESESEPAYFPSPSSVLAGSQWRMNPSVMRYLEAYGTPGAVPHLSSVCPEPFHTANEIVPVYSTGTRYFRTLKPGYPGVEATSAEVLVLVSQLCAFHDSLLPWQVPRWKELCHETAGNADAFRWNWPRVHVYLDHIVGIQLSGAGFSGPWPHSIANISGIVELDVSRNNLFGMTTIRPLTYGLRVVFISVLLQALSSPQFVF